MDGTFTPTTSTPEVSWIFNVTTPNIGLDNIKLSMAKQGDFSAGYVQAVGEHHSRYSGTSAHLTVEWIEATQDEPELMDA
ncbi:hypothetical protein SNOG_09380 [Parastagonospora nodorum SN15]|uniref:Uncharacterized protein n=1 Tax=Phaeosphaeria nodorum (strain SN15 / ATCC MYA-4574 / FGSC 10173) TaxID=321614 RepID=Q0UFT4_PHANO|nr:hypothetical protein SNOG_09380 [Parastagonospora nodorum SN15]EAT83572.1 hypothetical protein SNOG_09380 [Parastagonospora nodorum SN15]